jgi:hypothetical protein
MQSSRRRRNRQWDLLTAGNHAARIAQTPASLFHCVPRQHTSLQPVVPFVIASPDIVYCPNSCRYRPGSLSPGINQGLRSGLWSAGNDVLYRVNASFPERTL